MDCRMRRKARSKRGITNLYMRHLERNAPCLFRMKSTPKRRGTQSIGKGKTISFGRNDSMRLQIPKHACTITNTSHIPITLLKFAKRNKIRRPPTKKPIVHIVGCFFCIAKIIPRQAKIHKCRLYPHRSCNVRNIPLSPSPPMLHCKTCRQTINKDCPLVK